MIPLYHSLLQLNKYRGPQPTIPKFIHPDSSEFVRFGIALENLLPSNVTELFKCDILIDHLKLWEAKLIADAYINSQTPYTDTMINLANPTRACCRAWVQTENTKNISQ